MNFKKKSLLDWAASCGLWSLILAVTFWSFNRDEWITSAMADYVVITLTGTATSTQTLATGQVIVATRPIFATITHVSTLTGTFTDGGPTTFTGSSTDTNCSTGGTNYSGGSWGICNSSAPQQQKNAQQDNQGNNNNGSNEAAMLGMMAIAAGMALVAAGVALMPPPCSCGMPLIIAGMMLIMSGMAALAAASQMGNNANKSGNNAANLDNLAQPYQSTISTAQGGSTNTDISSSSIGGGTNNLGAGNTSGIKIDPALLRSGKVDSIMQDMEQKTGMNRDDFAKALAGGADPLAMLANSPALAGKPGASEANLQKMMEDAKSKGGPMSAQDVMDKLGITKDDLGAGNGSGGGADPNRGLAGSNAGPNIDSLFPAAQGKDGPSGMDKGSGLKLSPEVQAALDKNGITGRTLFQMVHSQYVKKTPLMFGVQKNKDGTAPNPYSSLSGEKVDL